jgi:hypothetical protein
MCVEAAEIVLTFAQQRNERKELAENEVERKTDETITNFPDVLTRSIVFAFS